MGKVKRCKDRQTWSHCCEHLCRAMLSAMWIHYLWYGAARNLLQRQILRWIFAVSFPGQFLTAKGENMVTEADMLLLKSRINELEEKVQFLYRRLNIDYAAPTA